MCIKTTNLWTSASQWRIPNFLLPGKLHPIPYIGALKIDQTVDGFAKAGPVSVGYYFPVLNESLKDL